MEGNVFMEEKNGRMAWKKGDIFYLK
jgi:hypothetical protein